MTDIKWAEEKTKDIVIAVRQTFPYGAENLVKKALLEAERRGVNEACDLLEEITRNDTNKVVANHCWNVAQQIRKLNRERA